MGLSVYRTRCAFVAAAVFLLAAALFVAGYFLPLEINRMLSRGIQEQVIVDSNSSTGYADWQDTSLPGQPVTYMKFHVFNITNPDEYLAGALPNVVDIGPYSYIERRKKLNVSFPNDGELAKYWLYEYFLFDPTTSGVNPETGLPLDPCTDEIFSAYSAYQAVNANLGDSWWSSLAFSFISSHVGVDPVHLVPVQELIWGIDCEGNPVADPLLSFVATLQPGTPTSVSLQVNLTSPEETLTTTGYSMQYTGKGNISLLHRPYSAHPLSVDNDCVEYTAWNSVSEVSVWATPEANQVTGTDGFNWPPDVKPAENLTVWVDSLMRAVTLLVNTTLGQPVYKDIEGIKCIWYTVNQGDFEPNPAFFTYGPFGVLNLTTASNGAPVFISKPHFLDASNYYLQLVTGLEPNRTLHDTNVFVEPISGIMMLSQKRLQINLNINSSLLYPQMSPAYVPVAWVEESGGITPKLASKFKAQVYGARKIHLALMWVGYLAGGLLVLCGLAVVLSLLAPDRNPTTHDPDTQPLLRDTVTSPDLLNS